jgi:hypothetical protein
VRGEALGEVLGKFRSPHERLDGAASRAARTRWAHFITIASDRQPPSLHRPEAHAITKREAKVWRFLFECQT